MVFSSLAFLFRFLPIFLLLYFIIPKKYRNYFLLFGSIVFYALGDYKHIFILAVATIINYLIGIYINQMSGKNRKILFVCGLSYHILILFFFKYSNFFLQNLNMLFHHKIHLPSLELTLPLVNV